MRLKAIFSYVGPDLESSLLQLKSTQIEQVKHRIKLLGTPHPAPQRAWRISLIFAVLIETDDKAVRPAERFLKRNSFDCFDI